MTPAKKARVAKAKKAKRSRKAPTREAAVPERAGRAKPTTVEEYIDAAPAAARKHLRELRALLREVAPEAKEALKWGSPVLEEKRILFAYAAFRTHLNFMPTPSAMKAFEKELTEHATGKGSVQLPYDQPLPRTLIRRIAAFRLEEAREKDARWM